jgi:predicted ribosome quality control (RQC) complex YloA/Tae2 family protein
MAFDAGMLACVVAEIREKSLGARIEKVFQPERDEIVLQMRSFEGGRRLCINAGSNNPRIGFTSTQRENPQNPPMLCMLLRKYLQGAKLTEVTQADFDRVAYLGFDTRDEMGFECRRYLIVELMGKYSNMLFCDGDKKIITAMRTSDLSLDSARPLLAGMTYELPPMQDKHNPMHVDEAEFAKIFGQMPAQKPCDKAIVAAFAGVAPVVAREIVFRATGHTDTPVCYCFAEDIAREFFAVVNAIKNESFSPCIVFEGERPVEYSFLELSQYTGLETKSIESAGELLDAYFVTRDNQQRVRQRASDILKLLNNAETRIKKKLELQRAELVECEKGSEYKKFGDLITANIYRLSRGDTSATFDDYENMRDDGSFPRVTVELDSRLSPSANAQRYYKRYNKSKNARVELTKQIELGEAELEYVYTVFEALSRAETPTDLSEIRDELYRSGYASKMKSYAAHKSHAPVIMEFLTPDGMRVLCGKNNVQNEHITHRLAEKMDYWFHAKNTAGSHVVLVTEGREPTDLDFTTAAEIAAYYSKSEGTNIAVDYTHAKNVKRVAGAKPGFVIYHTNWTAYVTPDAEKIAAMRKK